MFKIQEGKERVLANMYHGLFFVYEMQCATTAERKLQSVPLTPLSRAYVKLIK